MKVNFTTHPHLRMFESRRNVLLFLKEAMPKNKEQRELAEGIMFKLIQKATKNIDVITDSFIDAVIDRQENFKAIDRYQEFKDNKDSGVFVTKHVSFIYTSTVAASVLYIVDRTGIRAIIEYVRVSNEVAVVYKNIDNVEPFISMFVSILIFKKYVKIEIEEIEGSKKSKQKVNKSMVAPKLPFDVNIVNCTWFTTLVRSSGFKVRGHFRLQPKKDENGEWTKELIYVNEFEKQGYTRVAKIESNK